MALASYRHVLRAITIAFKGDTRMLSGAKLEARQRFEDGRSFPEGSKEKQEAIKHAEDVAKILRQNIVQGQMSDNTYKLRIHNETERGDNETVKVSGQQLKEVPAKEHLRSSS